MVQSRFRSSLVVFSVVLLLIPIAAFAAKSEGGDPIAHMKGAPSFIEWTPNSASHDSLVLVVTTPEGVTFERTFSAGATPSLQLKEIPAAVDGAYTWELRTQPNISAAVRRALTLARKNNDDAEIARIRAENGIGEPVIQSGVFTVKNGAFLSPDAVEPAAAASAKSGGSTLASQATTSAVHNPTTLDQVIADDLIVQGSACVGLDCVNNESFGFDTIRLKENNTRIKFDDTSTSTGFPNVDWQLTANDSNSGGANKFSIEDITNSKVPFTVTAAAPTNSLFVASSGKVGFGNASPVLNLHITATDTPAIRQEQTNGGGFTAQTWDIGANEANWFVRDVTGGSRLPLRIRPGAPTSSIDIAASGFVGVGTASPGFPIDVRNANAQLIAWQRNSGSVSNVFAWQADGAGTYLFNATASSFPLAILNDGKIGFGTTSPTNPIQHSNGAFLSSGGVWTDASSRELKTDIVALTAEEAKCTLNEMNPVKFAYKIDPSEHHVGFIAEDVPDLIAAKGRKGVASIDVVAVLTQVVKDQQKTIDQLKDRLDQLEKKQQ